MATPLYTKVRFDEYQQTQRELAFWKMQAQALENKENKEMKCKCGREARYRIWVGYLGYEYYCDKCKEEQTIKEK